MKSIRHFKSPIQVSTIGLMVVAFLILGIASCTAPYRPTRRTEANLDPGWPRANNFFHQTSYGRLQVPVPAVPNAEFVNDDELCATCHEAYTKTFAETVHRGLQKGQSCEACHGPASRHLETKGKEPGLILSFKTLSAAEKAELCLKCHEEDRCAAGARYRYSKHAHCGVACTDCHTGHYNVPEGTPATSESTQTTSRPLTQPVTWVRGQEPQSKPSLAGTSNNMGAVAPDVCYQCHSDMSEFEQVAGPHQICGPNGFNCTTCHDPHGQIRQETRKDLCLECHKAGAPTMGFHSSTHDLQGVACTDCHNPHPRTQVPQIVEVSHTQVTRPRRMQMSVQEPEACYKCHQKIFGLNALPSHHPIKEGKMVCSDCHDGHGQLERNLKGESINLVCYKCHAEKQGPHVYEHPPVTENCAICHEPHGTVANNLLRQPTTFLCLRCHDGHRNSHGSGNRNNIDTRPWLQAAFYTDCTQCHRAVHGTNERGTAVTSDFNRF